VVAFWLRSQLMHAFARLVSLLYFDVLVPGVIRTVDIREIGLLPQDARGLPSPKLDGKIFDFTELEIQSSETW